MNMNMSHGGNATGSTCEMSMLWNWQAKGSCILAEKWHNKSGGAFAASCIGVLLLAVTLESLRHWCKRYDQLVARQLSTPAGLYRLDGGGRTYGAAAAYETGTRRATAFQQLIRALLHVTVVCVGYILMLILMSFNGYLFICTLIGTGIGNCERGFQPSACAIRRGDDELQEEAKLMSADCCS